ncbi:GNAT family N-acetyltransferase [Lactiplantibacillus modestisalitolerans]|uniref:GNAT family N-acetyltransferase n=2 Tax=Lactiplantibacillus modestisalitolerans TaxID=1457219 RepID=A0ABV5WRX2_9LACO|nr:GNAT family N-acetyltransferase [Lactiplantibacillus modestisalitolerans]
MLTHRPITTHQPYYSQVCQTMREAFPPAELAPMWLLNLFAHRKAVHFSAFFDHDQFCGLCYYFESQNHVLIAFLAVNSQARGHGYGSQILDAVKHQTMGKTIVLSAEARDASAPNALQREKRFHFYQQNGIFETGHSFKEGGVRYALLASRATNVKTYHALLRQLLLGLGSKRTGTSPAK